MEKIVTHLTCQLELGGHFRTANAYRSAMRSIFSEMEVSDMDIKTFTTPILQHYQGKLISRNLSQNTISFYMRMLRAIYNKAVSLGYCEPKPDLFDNVFTGNDQTTKRAIRSEIFGILRHLNLSRHPELELCRDLFLLSFALQGISFIDLALLRKSNLKNNILTYSRAKTGSQVRVAVDEFAMSIIRKYSGQNKNSNFLLPIITNPDKDPKVQYQSALRTQNRRLQKIARLAGIEEHLTTYVARHTYATTARNEEVPMPMISHAMGHKTESVTHTYFADFDIEKLFIANAKVLRAANLIKPAVNQTITSDSGKNKNVRHLGSDGQKTLQT